MPSKIYFDINKVKTYGLLKHRNIKDFEGDKWILYESNDEGIWCMEWHEEKDQ